MASDKRYFSQFLYSILLIILIPGFMVFNTLWLMYQVRNDIDAELQRKAMLLSSTFGASVADSLDQPEKLQAIITAIANQETQIRELTVYKYEDEVFVPLASSNADRMKEHLTDPSTNLAWTLSQATATLEQYLYQDTRERVWSVVAPLNNTQGTKTALLNTKLSVSDIDELTEKTVRESFLILFGTILIILLMLINHFRLVESSQLFHKLKEIDTMKDDFISIASHELRTPIAVIKGYASMLLEGIGGQLDERGKQYMLTMINSTSRLEALVTDMLDVSKIEQGRMQFNLQPVNPAVIAQEIIDQFAPTAQVKNMRLEHQLPSQPITLLVDPDRLKQILFNLIGNALKYTEKGSVTVSYSMDAKQCGILIRDTGIGMSAQARKGLFKKFYRIKNDKTISISGTGLGLWITQELVQKMKGSIFVDSIEGEGSLFTVQFPILKPGEEPPTSSTPPPAEAPTQTAP